MQSYKGADFLDAGSLSRSRSTSFSSDSQHPRVNLMSPPAVRPPPAFISSSAASEIITSDQEFNTADFGSEQDATGAGANALVTPDALSLLNGFLDDLLFNILATSQSTQLASVRPAIAEVLKPRLASEVVATADEELYEYMGGTEDDPSDYRGANDLESDFDLIHAWKLTRLRCMVYTRLGDLEEEDEDEFIEQEGLGESNCAGRRFTSHVDNITPAAAIFLTSIIEHIGERALVIAGETARSRLSSKLNNRARDATDLSPEADGDAEPDQNRKRIDRLVVEDLDMEKMALNATLGRLWRTWRKRRRNATLSRSRTVSRESFARRGPTPVLSGSQKSSSVVTDDGISPRERPAKDLPAPVDPTRIPLPTNDDRDILEIEVPELSSEMEGEVQTMQAVVAHKVRPRSLMLLSSPSLASKFGDTPRSAGAIDNMQFRQIRCKSLPSAPAALRQPAEQDEAAVGQPSPPLSEDKTWLETMYEDDESMEYVDATEVPPGTAITTSYQEEAVDQPRAPSPTTGTMSVLREEDESAQATSMVRALDNSSDQIAASLRSLEGKDLASEHGARLLATSLNNSSSDNVDVLDGKVESHESASTMHQPRRVPSRRSSAINAPTIIEETSEGEMPPTINRAIEAQGGPASPGATIELIGSDRGAQASGHAGRNISVISSEVPDAVTSDDATRHIPRQPIQEQSFDFSQSDRQSHESIVNELPIVHEISRPASAADSERSQRSARHQASSLLGNSSNRTSTQLEQRAAVQRMPRPTPSIATSIKSSSSRSGSVSSAREKRPGASTSPTSQVSSKLKGLVTRPQSDSPSLRVRSSSETSRASGSAGSLENDSSDLDKLINSDETIHFTLTPRSVREMSFPEPSRHIPRSSLSNTADLADVIRNTGPNHERSRTRGSISSRHATETTSSGSSKALDSPRHIPIASRMVLPPKSPAREIARTASSPTVVTDFADSRTTDRATSAHMQQPTSPVRPSSGFSTNTTNTARSNPNRPRLQARPAETGGSQTSDLIDFIREGPPSPGAHRIPRTVAPFRNTIDSEDLHYDHSPEKDQTSSFASTRDESNPNKSLTSLGSRTRLLDSSNPPDDQNKDASAKFSMQDDDRPVPVRRQKRIPGRAPDPYAIDDDDDDEYLEELLNEKPPQREEESLLDFLRSEPPPDFSQQQAQAQPQPFHNVAPPPKAGGMGMRSRLMRGSPSGERAPSSKMSISSLRSQLSLSSQQGQQSNYSYKVGMARNPGVVPSSAPRQTDTSALADFLRNTGPPEPPVGRDMGVKEKETGFSRFFARRKKVEA
ncbi:Uncharacterized protein PECH_002253 [Penicillium ucsense]|uniref:Uncharacterized protein n=1 Tax=Penicillium ucsense TaxID=2839758 RepID=A0A8J8VYG9_9EURO|nr:Uncharacterized protein PECM_000428 [Penicillium ucsense]KAF7731087.1 Uncharacterized protein PECH_002253 [Penicillium ucsense]